MLLAGGLVEANWICVPPDGAVSVPTQAVAAGVQAAEDEPELLVELGRERIYEGESVQYEVTLNRVQDPQPPKLEGFEEFQVEFLGERSLDSQQITIINGRMTKDVRYGRAYRYALTPKRSGTLQIPAPVAEVAGRSAVEADGASCVDFACADAYFGS